MASVCSASISAPRNMMLTDERLRDETSHKQPTAIHSLSVSPRAPLDRTDYGGGDHGLRPPNQIQKQTETAERNPRLAELWIFNETRQPIEVETFGAVPFTYLEQKDSDEGFHRGEVGECGNGYVTHRIAAMTTASFPLWTTVGHGPSKTGTYRVVLPYTLIGRKGRKAREASSDEFKLLYGDAAPTDWTTTSKSGIVVLIGTTAQRVRTGTDPSPVAATVAVMLRRAIEECVAGAQKRLPWLRGAFTLTVYRYPRQTAPVLFLAMSLLGDGELNACLGAIHPEAKEVSGQYDLTFAVSHPMP